jgi:hypothetical protein
VHTRTLSVHNGEIALHAVIADHAQRNQMSLNVTHSSTPHHTSHQTLSHLLDASDALQRQHERGIGGVLRAKADVERRQVKRARLAAARALALCACVREIRSHSTHPHQQAHHTRQEEFKFRQCKRVAQWSPRVVGGILCMPSKCITHMRTLTHTHHTRSHERLRLSIVCARREHASQRIAYFCERLESARDAVYKLVHPLVISTHQHTHVLSLATRDALDDQIGLLVHRERCCRCGCCGCV